MLPVKKIYINSNFKTADSESNSNFKFQLSRTFSFPKKSVFYIENFTCSHAWYSVEEGFNDSVCVNIDGQGYTRLMSSGNYTGETLATELQGVFNSLRANVFTVRYNNSKNNITISVVGSTTFKMLTDDEAEVLFSTRNTINNILQNTTGKSDTYSSSKSYTSGFIELLNIRNIYLHSPNLSSFTTYGGKGESNIIKKIPVSSDFGYLIIENFTSNHDWLSCASLSLSCLEVQLRDANGKLVPLHNSNVSFAIVFSKISEEDN
jgi:hypothetical protein